MAGTFSLIAIPAPTQVCPVSHSSVWDGKILTKLALAQPSTTLVRYNSSSSLADRIRSLQLIVTVGASKWKTTSLRPHYGSLDQTTRSLWWLRDGKMSLNLRNSRRQREGIARKVEMRKLPWKEYWKYYVQWFYHHVNSIAFLHQFELSVLAIDEHRSTGKAILSWELSMNQWKCCAREFWTCMSLSAGY